MRGRFPILIDGHDAQLEIDTGGVKTLVKVDFDDPGIKSVQYESQDGAQAINVAFDLARANIREWAAETRQLEHA